MPPRSTAPWPEWTAWRPLGLELSEGSLRLLLDDGQAFRWHFLKAEGFWVGLWGTHVLALRLEPSGPLEWSCPELNAAQTAQALSSYFSLGVDWAEVTDALPWRSDAHLATCISFAPGLRLLKQPFGETLLCFLCSATKQIPQIKQMTELLALQLGKAPRVVVPEACRALNLSLHALPEWSAIAAAGEQDLRACKLGFRAKNIFLAARFIVSHPGWLEETEALEYPEAKARLMQLPGVGEKIADCVLLYGAGKRQSFPVDTWILKVMARRYGLEDWDPILVAQFGRQHFGNDAGLAQQFLFNYERSGSSSLPGRARAQSPRSL